MLLLLGFRWYRELLIFCHGEGSKRQHLGFHFVAFFLCQGSFGGLCLHPLSLIVVENRIHILPRPWPSLRLVAFPENIKQLAIADAIRVIVNLDCLGMVTHLGVGWSVYLTASVSNTCSNHALDNPELGFDAPKSAQTKGRSFDYRWHPFINGRYLRRFNFGFWGKVHSIPFFFSCITWLHCHYEANDYQNRNRSPYEYILNEAPVFSSLHFENPLIWVTSISSRCLECWAHIQVLRTIIMFKKSSLEAQKKLHDQVPLLPM